MPWTAAAFSWGSLITGLVFFAMFLRGVWFLRRRPEFVFARREAYFTAFWFIVSLTVFLSLAHTRTDPSPELAVGRCVAAFSSVLLAVGLWLEERRLLEWPTPREIAKRLDTQADIEALRQTIERFGVRPDARKREVRR